MSHLLHCQHYITKHKSQSRSQITKSSEPILREAGISLSLALSFNDWDHNIAALQRHIKTLSQSQDTERQHLSFKMGVNSDVDNEKIFNFLWIGPPIPLAAISNARQVSTGCQDKGPIRKSSFVSSMHMAIERTASLYNKASFRALPPKRPNIGRFWCRMSDVGCRNGQTRELKSDTSILGVMAPKNIHTTYFMSWCILYICEKSQWWHSSERPFLYMPA